MDTNVYSYFLAVQRYGSYARAAKDLKISPQGLSSSIHRLEEDLGVALFDNASGKLTLTQYGTLFYEQAKNIDESINNIRRGIETLRSHEQNIIRLGCSLGIVGYLGEHVIRAYNDKTTNAQVIITEEVPDYASERLLLQRQCDFCLITNPVDNPDLICVPIVNDYQFFWVNRNNSLARLKEITPKDLDGQTIFTVDDGFKSADILFEIIRQLGSKVKILYTSEMIRIYESARANHGIGLTCRNHIEATSDSSLTVGIPFKSMPWGFSLCYRRDNPLSIAELDFLDYMRSLRHDYI